MKSSGTVENHASSSGDLRDFLGVGFGVLTNVAIPILGCESIAFTLRMNSDKSTR